MLPAIKIISLIPIIAFFSNASAQTSFNNINLPSTQWQQGSDRVRAADGTECSTSTAPRSKWIELGATGGSIGGQGSDYSYQGVVANGTQIVTAPQNNYNRAGGALFAKLIINLDRPVAQLDCNRLYETELERLQEENKQLRMGAVNAKPYATTK